MALTIEERRAYGRRHYRANRELYIARAKTANAAELARRKNYIRELKESNSCVDCGGHFHFAAMDFDHPEGVVKVKAIARMVNRSSWQAVLDEIEKCELVCSNCHRVRTFERLQAPLAQG